jgi:hypothetical protein
MNDCNSNAAGSDKAGADLSTVEAMVDMIQTAAAEIIIIVGT